MLQYFIKSKKMQSNFISWNSLQVCMKFVDCSHFCYGRNIKTVKIMADINIEAAKQNDRNLKQ